MVDAGLGVGSGEVAESDEGSERFEKVAREEEDGVGRETRSRV